MIDAVVGKVQVRSANGSTTFGANLEACDAVAGFAIPDAYSEKDDVTPATLAGQSATLADGDSVPVLSDDGDKSTLETVLAGTNNDLVFTAAAPGAQGDDITIEYAVQAAASAPIAVQVTDKAIKVLLANTAGTKQKDTATVLGTVTAPVLQKDTATAAGTITAPVAQVETATAVATVTTGGNAAVVVTGDDILGSPITLAVAVATSDDSAAVAGKIRTALAANAPISEKYTVSGATDKVVLTRIFKRANDSTLNIAIATGTAIGITTAATSANTTAGVASGSGLAKAVVTAAGLTGSPLTVRFGVLAGDTASQWAAKCRTALGNNAAIAARYNVGGTTTAIYLERKVGATDDATLNIALSNDTSTGVTTAATSADTTAGVAGGGGNATVVITSAILTGSPLTVSVPVLAGDTASVVAQKIRDALGAIDAIVGTRPNRAATAKFVVGGSGATVTLTAVTAAANDTSLNISVDNGTCTGLTTAASSADTVAGVAVAISSTATQVKDAIEASAEAAALVTVDNAAANTGAGVVTVLAETPLASGADPTVDSTGTAIVTDGEIVGVVS